MHHQTHQFSLQELGDIVGGAEDDDEDDVLGDPADTAVSPGHHAASVPVNMWPANCTVSGREN